MKYSIQMVMRLYIYTVCMYVYMSTHLKVFVFSCLQENLENGYNIKSSPMLPASGSNLIQERYFFIYA